MSEEFLNLLRKFSAPISSCASVTVCSQAGNPINTRNYYIVTFYPVEITKVADERSRYELWEPQTVVRIDEFVIREDFSEHFVKIAHSARCPSICSKDFYLAAVEMGVKGVDFVPIKEFRWMEALPI